MEKNVVNLSVQIEKRLHEILRHVAFETRSTQREIIEKALRYYFEVVDKVTEEK